MIKLQDIAKQVIKEGGKAFGDRASRVSTSELKTAFEYLRNKISSDFSKFEIPRTLNNKESHGDIDIVVINDKGHNIKDLLQQKFGSDFKDFLKNGNVNSALITIPPINKDCHVDIITTGNEEDYGPQLMYLHYGDFSGILGVFARRCKYNFGTQGLFKIYEDKRKQYHYIPVTKNLEEGLKILGFSDDNISKYKNGFNNEDEVIDFIISSPLFDSDFYRGMMLNNSDRKRCRIGRPSADYIRRSLMTINKTADIKDPDYFLKKLYPQYVDKINKAIHEIENKVVATSKYSGDWIIKNFPQVKPGPIFNQIKTYWAQKFGKDNIDSQSEESVINATQEFLNTIK